MQWLKNFLAKYNISAHTVAVVGSSLVAFYNFNTQFHTTVLQVYGYFPSWLKTGVELGVAYYMWYRNSEKRS